MIERRAATAFLRNRGRILILKRGDTAPTFPGLWSAVSGSVEPTERPLARARDEILEETAIRGARLVARGGPVFVRHDATVFVVFPFLFDVPTRQVRLDRENTDARWVRPAELPEYHTVPRLSDALAAVLPQGA
ncbi:MAG TPA: NUDIX domain-containing protein [Thermoplasmata archaeon]